MKLVLALLACLVTAPAHAGEWTISSPKVLKFSGIIAEGEFDRFNEKFSAEIDTIIVDSPGGLITEGLRIGQVLIKRDITVKVQGLCMSSCANYIFLAAKHRIIGEGIVGFHGNHTAFYKDIKAMVDKLPEEISLQLWRVGYELPANATEETIKAEMEKSKLTMAAEANFFSALGISQDLFDRAIKDDKGMDDGKHYYMLLPTQATFEKYGIRGVQGKQSAHFLENDSRVLDAAAAGHTLLLN